MKKITTTDILHFFRQLSALMTAGISLMKSLDLLIQATDKPALRLLILALRRDLDRGWEFNRCLQHYPHLFDPLICQLIRIGEQTGTLDRILKKVVFEQEKNQNRKKELQQALIYPSVLLITACATTLALLLFVVPQFATLFEHFPNKLPLPTRVLTRLAASLRHFLPYCAGLVFLGLFTLLQFRSSQQVCERARQLIFQIPGLRKLALGFTLARFARNLGAILSSGLPLTEALLLVAPLSFYAVFKKKVLRLHAGVNAGKPLSLNFSQHSCFPPLLCQMTRIGEESGTLDRMLEKFADILEAELEKKLNTLKLLLEPLIIAILGALIGGVVIAMYLPVFRLGTAIS